MLGADHWREPRLGAKDLLSEILDNWSELSRADWCVDRIKDDETARVGYQRIAALARALRLGTVADLVRGKFLDGGLGAGRRAVISEIAAQCNGVQSPGRGDVPDWLFAHLLHYRSDVDRVVRATSGWDMCSDGALLGMIATQDRIGQQIEPMMVDIDRWICTLMDPDHRAFALSELVAEHGWPDVDLDAIGWGDL